MVANINGGKSIAVALNYNEQKLKLGTAACLQAFNFLKDVEKLDFDDKLWHFNRLISLNERTKINSFHVSLNFHPSEKLSDEKLREIARVFMQKIGFGDQPFLVYNHFDAAHPHIHILSTTIKENGKRINVLFVGPVHSSRASREIETEFNLVKAEGRKLTESMIRDGAPQKLIYGNAATMLSVTEVLRSVINQYKYTSMVELNAILRLYNLAADPGKEGSKLHSWRGLYYRVLDDQGTKVGAPIKASSIYFRPTLAYLEKKFAENQSLRLQYEPRLRTMIDWNLIGEKSGLAEFVKSLEKEQINTLFNRDKQGLIQGISFVDHQTKAVFSGNDLGEQYHATAIQERCGEIRWFQQRKFEGSKRVLDTAEFPEPDIKHVAKVKLASQVSGDSPFYELRKGKRERVTQSHSNQL
jgi:hypothetical protein